jgi:hypothetical protein
MHSIESGEIRLTPRVAYDYEKPLVVLILIGTCGCRGQVIRLTTVDVFFLINEMNFRDLQGIAGNSSYHLGLKKLYDKQMEFGYQQISPFY